MRLAIAMLMLLLLAPLVRADDEPKRQETVAECLQRIEKSQSDHKDFIGKFKQEKHILLFDEKIESNGRFVFRKPNNVRWEYEKPHQSILVIAGDDGQKWTETTKKVEKFKLSDDRGLDAVVKQLFTWFKGEFTKLGDDYDVEIAERSPTKLKMTPKKDVVKKFIASIEVKFTEKDAAIASVKITEPGDDYVLYTFSETKLDSGVKDEEFEIKK
ncbi:hypothetical protein PLCT2_01984 [Planctomycetaceae bacterium]|nr:hypothetical protein PLCT2_01984 [Planctomycetaceae bacterium]